MLKQFNSTTGIKYCLNQIATYRKGQYTLKKKNFVRYYYQVLIIIHQLDTKKWWGTSSNTNSRYFFLKDCIENEIWDALLRSPNVSLLIFQFSFLMAVFFLSNNIFFTYVDNLHHILELGPTIGKKPNWCLIRFSNFKDAQFGL